MLHLSVTTIHGELPWTSKTEWLYPSDDIGTINWWFRHSGMLDVDMAYRAAFPYLNGHRVAIQAGGCIGVWAIRLSQLFNFVHVFEPEPVNYICTKHNTEDIENIKVHQQALGATQGTVSMRLEPDYQGHCGAFHAVDGGDIERITIDSLKLNNVDFIWLDIEGGEGDALCGARRTLELCRPVVGFEMREFAVRSSNPMKCLEPLGYKSKGKVFGHDWMMVNATTAP